MGMSSRTWVQRSEGKPYSSFSAEGCCALTSAVATVMVLVGAAPSSSGHGAATSPDVVRKSLTSKRSGAAQAAVRTIAITGMRVTSARKAPPLSGAG